MLVSATTSRTPAVARGRSNELDADISQSVTA